MTLADEVAKSSRDPSSKIGSVIVAPAGLVLSTGFNDILPGVPEHEMVWERPAKYLLVRHSEVDALLKLGREDLSGCVLYVTCHPCRECMKLIAHQGLKRVVFRHLPTCVLVDNEEIKASAYIARKAGITLHEAA
jgi:dCMP deaminase